MCEIIEWMQWRIYRYTHLILEKIRFYERKWNKQIHKKLENKADKLYPAGWLKLKSLITTKVKDVEQPELSYVSILLMRM